jgi:hypothetical protein
VILNDGKPIIVESDHDRIGRGAWARLFASAIVGDESSAIAERGRTHAREGDVSTVRIVEGEISAEVDGCTVMFGAAPIPPRIWSAIARSARNEAQRAGVEGREQSVHLESLMRFEWDEPLTPDRARLRRSCTCHADASCEHVAAVAYVIADQIDRDPSVLLRWRGVEAVRSEEEPDPVPSVGPLGDEPWEEGPLPRSRELRPLPVGAVLKSLGESGIRVGVGDLADALQRAYASFARR